MARHDPLRQRSGSVDTYLRETRVLAAIALLALVGGLVSDAVGRHFWNRHPLLSNLAASVIVVMLSVALVNEAIERRRRRRWRVLAQYVMLELVRLARLAWTGISELAGLMPADEHSAASIDAGARAVRDTPRLAEAIRALVADVDRRRLLHDGINRFVSRSNDVLGRWAAVMLNADAYAELIDRHVELASDVAWLGNLLDQFEPIDEDRGRRRLSRSSPAVQMAGEIDDERLADRLVSIAQLAEELDRGTLELALRIVPVEWWAARHGRTAPISSANPEAPPSERPVA
jgi:hypothetical protein